MRIFENWMGIDLERQIGELGWIRQGMCAKIWKELQSAGGVSCFAPHKGGIKSQKV